MAHIRLAEITRDAMANKVEAAADKMMRHFERTYTKKKDPAEYKGMLAMGRDDKSALYQIARHIRDGRFDLAAMQADRMDTAARDEIPTTVYDLL